MATTFTSNMYPPIVDTYMPAFLYGSSYYRIYVTLSPYMSISNNIPVHINVVNQRTNKSALIAQNSFGLQLDGEIRQEVDTGLYYVDLDNSKFNFLPYTYYKVQFRTCKTLPNFGESAEAFLNRAVYSEWSTACLIKMIKTPTVKLSYFTNKIELDDGTEINGEVGIRFPDSAVFVSGKVSFEDNTGSNIEYLKNYQVNFYDSNNELLEDSSILSPLETGVDEINYISKYNFQPEIIYKMIITFLSSSLYEWKEEYNFVVNKSQEANINFLSTLTPDEENGRVKLNIKVDINETNPNYNKDFVIYIRRTDSKTNYKYWEDIYSYEAVAAPETFLSWDDVTVESGIWYKYAVQYSINGLRHGNYIIGDKILLLFDNSFLIGQNGQCFKLKYDTTVDSYMYHQNTQITETIGNKYPFIRQNGAMYYRTFTISGLITYLTETDQESGGYVRYNKDTDDGSLFSHSQNELISKTSDTLAGSFITKEILYETTQNLSDYEEYFDLNEISDYNNYIQERFFREAAINFLLDSNVKLFKSTTEGNILVQLSEVNFTPKTELGRYLYSFSAKATECAEATVENYSLYKIQALSNTGYKLLKPSYNPNLVDTTTTIAANGITATLSNITSEDNVKTIIENTYQEIEGYKLFQINFFSLGFSFISDPYLINTTTLTPEIGDDEYHQLGYIITLDDKSIFVSAEDRFKEFRGQNELSVQNISFPVTTDVNILMDAQLIYIKTDVVSGAEDSSIDFIKSVYQTYSMNEVDTYNNGIFNYEVNFIDDLILYYKLLYDQDETDVFILNPYTIKIIDAPTGAIFSMNDDSGTYTYLIGQTGNLNINLDSNLSDNRVVINQAYFRGILAVWEDNAIISDTIITLADSRIGYGLYYLESKWIWHEDNKDYDVKFYKDIQLTEEVIITSNTTLDQSKFTYLQILKPVHITGDIMINAKLTTTLNIE